MDLSCPVVIGAAQRRAAPWLNGQGITEEIARQANPAQPDRFAWRLSMARFGAAAPFSRFCGYRRMLAVLEGAAVLDFADRAEPVWIRPFQHVWFSGDEAVRGAAAAGETLDYNLIFDPSVVEATVQTGTGPFTMSADAGAGLQIYLFGSDGILDVDRSPWPFSRHDALFLPLSGQSVIHYDGASQFIKIDISSRFGNAFQTAD